MKSVITLAVTKPDSCRVLEEKAVLRVGGHQPTGGCPGDQRYALRSGSGNNAKRFRPDLFYRLVFCV